MSNANMRITPRPHNTASSVPPSLFNLDSLDYQSLSQLVANCAMATPDAVAVKNQAESLTYAELEFRSNRLANYLIGFGVGRETIVGIALERSIEAVISALAVLKAGACYLPLDPAY